jgi:hypothetical protein
LKRSLTDVLRRALVSTLANWPVIVARIVETVAVFGVVILAIVACVVPVVVSAGLSQWKVPEGVNPSEAVWAILGEHALLVAYLFVLLFAIAGVLLAIHSFVEAGAARIFIDADRAAPETGDPQRAQFAVYTNERFFAGARAAWWRIFWIYNGTLGLFGLIVLIPLLLVLILTVATAAADSVPLTLGIACGGLGLVTLVAIPTGLLVGMWSQKAVVVCVARDLPARDALRAGWREARADFGRHAGVFFVILVVSWGVAAMLSVFAPFTSIGIARDNFLQLITAPMQITLSIAQNAMTNAVGCWLIAAFAALTTEPPR